MLQKHRRPQRTTRCDVERLGTLILCLSDANQTTSADTSRHMLDKTHNFTRHQQNKTTE